MARSASAQLPKSDTQAASQAEEPNPADTSVAGVTRVRAGLRISLNSFSQRLAEVPAAGGGLISFPVYSGGLLAITKN